MKTIIVILLFVVTSVTYSQVSFQDIGNSRLIDTNGRLYVIPKPGRTLGSFNVIKPMIADSSFTVNGVSTFLGKIIGDINITGDFLVNDVPLTTSTDTSLLLHKYDSLRFPLRLWSINGHYLTGSFSITKADLGIDTTNYQNATNINTGTLKAARVSDSVLKISTFDTLKVIMKDQADSVSANQVFIANQDFNGFIKMGQDNTYVKIKIVKFKITATNVWYNIAHGLDWRNIIGLNLNIRHDTAAGYWLKQNLAPGYNASTPLTVGLTLNTDSISARWYCPLNSYALIDDSAFISIIYTNFY